MTRVETIGVVCGGGGAGGLNSVIRCLARAANNTPFMRAAGAPFEGGA
jgi:6-phosphofructokinase